MQKIYYLLVVFLITLFIAGCGASSSKNVSLPIEPLSNTENLPIPNNSIVEHYKVLLIGNSHTASNNLPEIIKALIKQGKASAEVSVERANGSAYLNDRVGDGITLEKINSEQWTHIILQAQKYSQSGTKFYSTAAAEYWIRVAKKNGATPILFPEHPQRGNWAEGQYVHDIHLSIVAKQNSCIAPIGLGWNKVLAALPELILHAPDGNHAAYPGSFFTALIFYQVITSELADALPTLESVPLSSDIQEQLGAIASQIIDEHQVCNY